MGNPIRTTTAPGTDALVASIVDALGLIAHDRTGGSILADPVIRSCFRDWDKFAGALATKDIYIGAGVNELAAVAEGTDFTVESLTDSLSGTLTLARRGTARQCSDMFRRMDRWGIADWLMFLRDSQWAWESSMVSLLASQFASFTATGGVTGTALTWAKVVATRNALGVANIPPPYVFITRPKDWGNISIDALALGGAVQMSPETQRYMQGTHPGYKGTFLDGELSVYTSSDIVASAGDHASAMFAAGALRWSAGMPTPSAATIPMLWTPAYGVEMGRIPLKSEDYVVTSSHAGACIGQNACGAKVLALT